MSVAIQKIQKILIVMESENFPSDKTLFIEGYWVEPQGKDFKIFDKNSKEIGIVHSDGSYEIYGEKDIEPVFSDGKLIGYQDNVNGQSVLLNGDEDYYSDSACDPNLPECQKLLSLAKLFEENSKTPTKTESEVASQKESPPKAKTPTQPKVVAQKPQEPELKPVPTESPKVGTKTPSPDPTTIAKQSTPPVEKSCSETGGVVSCQPTVVKTTSVTLASTSSEPQISAHSIEGQRSVEGQATVVHRLDYDAVESRESNSSDIVRGVKILLCNRDKDSDVLVPVASSFVAERSVGPAMVVQYNNSRGTKTEISDVARLSKSTTTEEDGKPRFVSRSKPPKTSGETRGSTTQGTNVTNVTCVASNNGNPPMPVQVSEAHHFVGSPPALLPMSETSKMGYVVVVSQGRSNIEDRVGPVVSHGNSSDHNNSDEGGSQQKNSNHQDGEKEE